MRKLVMMAGLVPLATASIATPPPPPPEHLVAQIASHVNAQRMRATVEKLVSFGTRHTLSSQTDPKRGIGAVLNWTEEELKTYSRRCGDCLEVGRASEIMEGRRLPSPTRITNVFAIQRGTERPNDVVIITGHIDSRVTDPMDAVKDAPGANDDGSGTAAVIEAARVLSMHKFPGTIVYAALSGEEQGLYGGKVMANYAKAQGWNVIANLNNDIIGNSCGSDGVCNDKVVRVFSEGPRWQGHEDLAARQRSLGGENDAPSRNISRLLDWLAERTNSDIGLDVMQVWRNDRHGRGGDHTEFLNSGFPAVRFSVAVENYNHQHQDLRTEGGIVYGDTIDKMDFPYLEKVTKLNVAALAWLASAPPPPEPTVEGAVSTDTTIRFPVVPRADRYSIRWRRTDANQWEFETDVAVTAAAPLRCNPPICEVVLKGVRVDDFVFGVSSDSERGFTSPVASAVPGGAFKPYTPPTPQP